MPALQEVSIPVSGTGGVGNVSIAPPTFLERWGVVFVSVGGLWMLLVSGCMLFFYLHNLPPAPPQTSDAAAYNAALDLHKTATEQFRDSVSYAFDLMITKTILPLVTLLLGYLFGKKI